MAKDKQKKNESKVKKRFSLGFGKKDKTTSVVVDSSVVVDDQEQKLISAARVSKLPQIDDHGLSYAGKHLLLLIQHQVDAEKIKVSSKDFSWKTLVSINQSVDLVEKKDRAKEICGIHHFGPETNDIAKRVTNFVFTHQRHNVI